MQLFYLPSNHFLEMTVVLYERQALYYSSIDRPTELLWSSSFG